MYDGASTKRGASGVESPAEVNKEGAEPAAEDDPPERSTEISRPSSNEGVDDDRL